MFGSLIVIGAALAFHRAAAYENLGAWKWTGASLLLSVVVGQLVSSALVLVMAQAVLFGFLWRQNLAKVSNKHQEWADRQEEDRRVRQERVRRAHEQTQQNEHASNA